MWTLRFRVTVIRPQEVVHRFLQDSLGRVSLHLVRHYLVIFISSAHTYYSVEHSDGRLDNYTDQTPGNSHGVVNVRCSLGCKSRPHSLYYFGIEPSVF